ncbi:Fe2+-dependent dioxygenase [Prochlorococcus marinus]|uniref:Fe2+-dependent dioxygenase n=1 Tax=Prochlorococcus marinus TaxID=1219 RepID=UPI0022B55CB9|nr:Fe2+-dependent dioxygenase [Prochlorococcus marinus]
MLYFTHKLFEETKAKDLAKRLIMSNEWVDGKASSARGSQVKKNLQLDFGTEQYSKLSTEIINILENDHKIKNYSFPAKIFNILFTRTGEGMFYGAHIDAPYVPTGRRDLSFTIFLNEKQTYKGGELILYISPEQKQIKLNPGEMIIYPTKYLHEVKEVTEGERMVCVGWIESQIPRDDDRESLFLMRTGISEITKQLGNTPTPAIHDLNVSFNKIYKRFLN